MLSLSKCGIDPLRMHGWLNNDVTLPTFVRPKVKAVQHVSHILTYPAP